MPELRSGKTMGNIKEDLDKLNIYESEDQLIIGLDFGTTYR